MDFETRKLSYRQKLQPGMTFVNRKRNVVEFFVCSLKNMLLLDEYKESRFSKALTTSYSTLVIGQMYGSGKTRFGNYEDGVFLQGKKEDIKSKVEKKVKKDFEYRKKDFNEYYKKILSIIEEYKHEKGCLGRYNYVKYDSAFESDGNKVILEWVEKRILNHLKLNDKHSLSLYQSCRLSKGECIFFHVDVIDKETNDEKLRKIKDYCAEIAQGFIKLNDVYCMFLFSGRSSSILSTGYGSNPSKVGTYRIFLQHFGLNDIKVIFNVQFGSYLSKEIIGKIAQICLNTTSGIPRYVEYYIKFVKLEKWKEAFILENDPKSLEEMFLKEEKYFQFKDSEIEEYEDGIGENDYGLFAMLFYSSKFGVDFDEDETIKGYKLLYLLNCYPLYTSKNPKTGMIRIVYPKILERTMLKRIPDNKLFLYFYWLPDNYSTCFLDVGMLFEFMVNVGFILNSRFSVPGRSWGDAFPFLKDSFFGECKSEIKDIKLLPKVTLRGKKLEELGYIKKVDKFKTIKPENFAQLVEELITCFGWSIFCIFRELSGSVDAMFIPLFYLLVKLQYKNTILEYPMVITETEKVIQVRGKKILLIFFAMKLGDSIKPFLEDKSHILVKEGVYIEYNQSIYQIEYLADSKEYYVTEKFGKCGEVDDILRSICSFLDEEFNPKLEKSMGETVKLFFTEGYSISEKKITKGKRKKRKKCINTKVLIVPKNHEVLIINENCVKEFIGEDNYVAVEKQKTNMEKNKLTMYKEFINNNWSKLKVGMLFPFRY